MMNKENTALQMIAEAARCPDYDPDMVKALMEKLDMNEKGFALLMNVSPSTVRLWTSGAAQPCGTAKRLIPICLRRFRRQSRRNMNAILPYMAPSCRAIRLRGRNLSNQNTPPPKFRMVVFLRLKRKKSLLCWESCLRRNCRKKPVRNRRRQIKRRRIYSYEGADG